MDVKTRRLIFYALWSLLLSVPLITFTANTNLSSAFSTPARTLNSLQRVTGMTAFILIFIQIMLGAFMNKWVQTIGSKAYRIHIVQGIVTYGLVLFHPSLYLLLTYEITGDISKVVLALLPSYSNRLEILLLFGKVALLLLSISVVAAFFRTKPFFRRNWRAFHVLNYLVFYSVFYHARIGTDLASQPFDTIYWLAFASVSATVVYRLFYAKISKVFSQKSPSPNKV